MQLQSDASRVSSKSIKMPAERSDHLNADLEHTEQRVLLQAACMIAQLVHCVTRNTLPLASFWHLDCQVYVCVSALTAWPAFVSANQLGRAAKTKPDGA